MSWWSSSGPEQTDGVSLEWDPGHLLNGPFVFHQDVSDSGDADSIYWMLSNTCWSSSVGSWLPQNSLPSFPQNQAMVDDIIHQPLCQFSQWLHWSLFGSGWLVITFVNTFSRVSQCVQLQFFLFVFFSYGCLERLRFCAKWNTQNYMHIYKNHTMLPYETCIFYEA